MSERNAIPGFGARLRAARDRAGMSQQDLASAAGTHPDSVVKLEKELRAPSLELACRVADALGITVLDLLPEGWPGSRKKKSKNSAD